MHRRQFLSQGIALSAMAAATRGRALAQSASGWDQLPGILARIVPPVFPDREFNIVDYGAQGDYATDCRPAIAAAIAACNAAGGGSVTVPPGTYLVNGPIHLLSNVNLSLRFGSIIGFGTNPADYLPAVEVRWSGIRCYNYSPLIYANGQTNIAITGAGHIHGHAPDGWAAWATLEAPDYTQLQAMAEEGVPTSERIFGAGHYLRPTLFEPYACTNVLVEGVSISGSPYWTLHPTFCTNVTIRNVKVRPGVSNDDGCDPDSCTDVLMDGCSFDTADDNISLKAGYGIDAVETPPCRNIVIRGCRTIFSNWGAYTMGSNTTAGVENVFIENCISNHCVAAFYIKSNEQTGGSVRSVWVRSCQASNCNHLLLMQTDYNDTSGGPSPPLYANLNFEDITCANADVCAFTINGDPRRPIEDVTLAGIAIKQARKLEQIAYTGDLVSSNITLAGEPVRISA